MTIFRWSTCDCVTGYSDAPGNALVEYVSKCVYHATMGDEEAFEELKSSHETKMLSVKAIRQALYGSQVNPNKGAEEAGTPLVPDGPSLLAFENNPSKRNVAFDGTVLTPGQRGQCVAELAQLNGHKGHAVVDRTPPGGGASSVRIR